MDAQNISVALAWKTEAYNVKIKDREYTVIEKYDAEVDYSERQYLVDGLEINQELIHPETKKMIDSAIDSAAHLK